MPFTVGLLLALAYIPPFPAGATELRWGLAAVAPTLLIRAVPEKILIIGLLFVLWAAFTIVWSADPQTGLFYLIQLTIIVSWLFVGAARNESVIKNLIVGLSCGIAVQFPLVLAQYFGATWVPQMVAPAGTFTNREVLGELAALLFVFNILAASRSNQLLAIPLGLTVLLCQSRVGAVAVGAGLFFVWLQRPKSVHFWFQLLVVLGICLAATIFLSLEAGKMASLATRFDIWKAALHGLSLFGRGIGAFEIDWPFWEFTHSDVIQIWYELGLPGIALTVLLARRAFLSSKPLAYSGLLVASAVEISVSFPLHTPCGAVLISLLVGHLAGRKPILRRSKPARGVLPGSAG